MLLELLTWWTHLLAAAGFTALSLWRLGGWRLAEARTTRNGVLVAALAATALWAWIAASEGDRVQLAHLAETIRNAAWLGFIGLLMRGALRESGARVVFVSVACILLLQGGLDLLPLFLRWQADAAAAIASTTLVLRITVAAGALVLVHNIYGQAAPEARLRIRLPMAGLAILWLYDLNLYTLAVLLERWPAEIAAMRGAVAAAAIPLFAFAGRDAGDWRIRLSRAATFQSLSVGAICAYFLVMTVWTSAGEATGWAWLRAAQILLLVVMTAGAAVLIPSGRARGWVRVKLTKHLFQHRYDYRAEWLRFTRMMGEAGPAAPPIGDRIVQAIADIVEAPGGMLLVPDDGGRLEVGARWNWDGGYAGDASDALLVTGLLGGSSLGAGGRVIDFGGIREGTSGSQDANVPIPAAMLADAALWAGVPLIHHDRLAGLVVLARPKGRAALDWEDFDLLRTAARGAASYLAEARGQEALANAERFDEFNRRFAFILHDIKNLVSGLSLLARNAGRHADNPDFRADMVATLQSSVDRMKDLLAKLSPQEQGPQASAAFPMTPLLDRLGANKRHEVRIISSSSAWAIGDATRLEQALVHLIDNAIDTSAPHAPVIVTVVEGDGSLVIAIADTGAGMSADFIRRGLFQPFSSTKPGGFGIGAHQARALIGGMGGRIDVDSRLGEGTRFAITLPAAPSRKAAA